MACTSGSVQSVANKTVAAHDQIERLKALCEADAASHKAAFYAQVDEHLRAAMVTDARELGYDSAVKIEYTSEFSLDKIAAVVISALKAAAAAQDPRAKSPAMGPEAIAAYADVVNAVAEAAKSSSTAAASLSFSASHLSPGLFAFLYASSVNIQDKDTFGEEAVTATAVHYRFMQSIDDVKNQAELGEAVIDAQNLLNMKTLQAALTDSLAAGKITIDEWMTRDQRYSEAVESIRKRLEAHSFTAASRAVRGLGAPAFIAAPHDIAERTASNHRLVRAALQRLATRGESCRVAIERSTLRLASGYY